MNEETGQQSEIGEMSGELLNQEPLVLKSAGIEYEKQKRKKKKWFIWIAAMLVVAGLMAYGSVKLQVPRRLALIHPSEETIRKDVTAYLEERYEEEFVITNIIFPSFNYASYIIMAYPDGKPQKSEYEIRIQGWEKKGLIDYYDNYPVVKLIPELKEYISDVVGEYFPENKVYVDFYNEWIRENIDKDFSLDEFLNDIEGEWHSAGWYDICILHSDQEDKELLNKINEMATYMGEKKLSGFFFVDVIFNNYDSLADNIDDLTLGQYGKDFINYNYVIDQYGNFYEKTEVKENGTK